MSKTESIELPAIINNFQALAPPTHKRTRSKFKEDAFNEIEMSSDGRGDIEGMSNATVIGREAGERDPLALRSKIVAEQDIDGLKHRKGWRRTGKKLANFYTAQNEHIEEMLKPLSTLSAEGEQDVKDFALKVKIAVNASLVANVLLAGLQLYAAISSLSLALFASSIDAVFDPLANLILYMAHRSSRRAEEKKWPVRGSRFETIYAFIMGGVNVILIVESIQNFITHSGGETKNFHLPSIIAVAVAFATKLCLFLYCYSIRQASSQVQVLWEDHRNDLLTNGFGILTSTGGSKLRWWIDPMGATIIAVCIITVWTMTMYEQFTYLAGIVAPVEYQNLVTYKAMTFSTEIQKVDTCRVYHSGPNYFVEVDIVLPPEMPLWQAHDISQDLQDQIEALPDVDRCFVHVDHEVSHKPEHRKKQQ